MFLSTAVVLILFVYFFDLIVIETPSVIWLRNQSRVFVHIFDYMYYSWLQMFSSLLVLDRTYPTWLGLCQNRVNTFLRYIFINGLYIALKFIEYQRLV